MKKYKIHSDKIGLRAGEYTCISHYMSYPFITYCDNFDMSEKEVIDWMDSKEKYILEVYDTKEYDHGNGD